MNWKENNIITPEMAGECFDTDSLTELFGELADKGYSGLGLGLIIDLIRRDAERVS